MTRRTVLADSAKVVTLGLFNQCLQAEKQRPAEEYELKAAFLFNIAKFAEWPTDAFGEADSPIVVAIVGRDPFGARLDQLLQGQIVNGRHLRVERVATIGELREVHIVFLNGVPVDAIRSGVLTVGDGKDFCSRGGMIALRIQNERLAMEVNLTAVNRGRLKLSAQLLKLATITGGAV